MICHVLSWSAAPPVPLPPAVSLMPFLRHVPFHSVPVVGSTARRDPVSRVSRERGRAFAPARFARLIARAGRRVGTVSWNVMFCHDPVRCAGSACPVEVSFAPVRHAVPPSRFVPLRSALPAADAPAGRDPVSRVSHARQRAFAPARFARLIARPCPRARAGRRAHVSRPLRWDFFAPAPARREAASGYRILPPNLGSARSDVKLFLRNISNFCEHRTCIAAEKPCPSGRGLGEGRAKREATGPQRARPPGSFKRNGPPRQLVPRDEGDPLPRPSAPRGAVLPRVDDAKAGRLERGPVAGCDRHAVGRRNCRDIAVG